MTDEGKDFIFTPGHVYQLSGRPRQLLRLICFSQGRDVLIFKKIDFKWDKVEKLAIEMGREKALSLKQSGVITQEPDCVRPNYISWSEKELLEKSGKSEEQAKKWIEKGRYQYSLIRELVSHEDPLRDCSALLAVAYSPLTMSAAVGDHAKRVGVSPLTIKRLLHKYAWFGLQANALLYLDSSKGSTGPFIKRYRVKTGSPDSAVEFYGERYRGKSRTSKDLTVFYEALESFYVNSHFGLMETYEAMLEHFYIQSNQHGVHPVGRGKVPTYRQFQYAARILIAHHGLEAKRAGRKDGKEMQDRRGYDTDISGEIGDVFDIDGTEFNRELVCSLKVDGESFNIGKPTVLIIFDRKLLISIQK